MQILIGILLVFYPPKPSVPIPMESGLFPEYGFSQTDSEKFVPILNLFQSRAYRVEEVDSDQYAKDTYIYNFILKDDSLIIEQRRISISANYSKDIYSRNGKLLYEVEFLKDRIMDVRYYDTNGNW